MIIAAALLLGIVIGFMRRGSVQSIFTHRYAKWWLGLVGIIIQIFVHIACYLNLPAGFDVYAPILNFVGYLGILIMLIFNLDDIFSILIAAGVTLNFIVTFINGGYMPVSESVMALIPAHSVMLESIYDGSNAAYALMQTPGTLLSFLATILPLPFQETLICQTGMVPGLSAGMVLILVGLVGLTQSAMVLGRRDKTEDTIVEHRDKYPKVELEPQPTFASKTEELFFEEQPLPKTPVDDIFKDDEPEDVLPTQVLGKITPPEEDWFTGEQVMQTYDPNEETKIWTGMSDLPEYLRQPVHPEPVNTQAPEEGFFTATFLAGQKAGERAYTDEEIELPERQAEEKQTEQAEKEEAELEKDVAFEPSVEIDVPEVDESPEEPEPEPRQEEIWEQRRRERGWTTNAQSGYVVSSAYQSEMDRIDKTEEEMMNVWSQVAEETRNRKLERRYRSTGGYVTNNPYQEEKERKEAAKRAQQEAARRAREAYEREQAEKYSRHQQQTAKRVNAQRGEDTAVMSDEERIAAGYEKVNFTVSGKEISFWRKKTTN